MPRRSLACAVAAWTLAGAQAIAAPPGSGDAGHGEDRPADEPTGLDRVVVTARRRPEPLHDVPQAITAVDGEELESRGATDISALDMVTPNLTIHPARAFNGSVTAHIRGVGQFDPIWGAEPGVGVYIDDVHLARPQGALLDVLEVERVVTRAPTADFAGRAALTAGDYGRREGRLVLNLPLADGVRTRLALAGYDRDGYGRNLFRGGGVSARDAAVARWSALWTPGDDLELRLSWDRYRDRSGPPGGRRLALTFADPDRTPPDPGRHDVRSGAAERLDLDSQGASLVIDWGFHPRWRLRSISAWREGDSQAVLDMDSLPVTLFTLRRDFAERQRLQEFQLHGEREGTHFIAGLYLFDGTEAGMGRGNSRDMAFWGARGWIQTRSAAAYANLVRDLAPGWQLDAGLRYTVERKTATAYNGSYADDSATVADVVTADFTDRATFNAPTPVADGRRFPNAPRWTAGTSLVAHFPLGGAGWMLARVDGRYQGETRPTTDPDPRLFQGGYSLWNASLAWTSPQRRWELALRVDNIGDTAYRTSGFTYGNGVVIGYYGPTRTYAMTLGYSF